MRLTPALLAVPLALSALTACGGGDEAGSDVGADPSASIGTPTQGSQPQLLGTIGTREDPEAYEIGLRSPDGNAVTSIAAGTYTLQIADGSKLHNFHLIGKGIDLATSVPDSETATVTITLVAGETYTFQCDPHTSSMKGTFTAT